MKGLILSSFGKLFIVPASIWGQSQSAIYILLTKLLIFTSGVAALKGKQISSHYNNFKSGSLQ